MQPISSTAMYMIIKYIMTENVQFCLVQKYIMLAIVHYSGVIQGIVTVYVCAVSLICCGFPISPGQ